MAVPAYATDLNDIFLDQSTGFTTLSGRVTFPETDDYIQGASCWSHDPFSSGIEGGVFGSTETIASDDAVFFWLKCDIVPAIATRAAGGMQALIGSSSTAYNGYYVRGNDDYVLGGWVCIPVDPVHSTASVTVGSPTATTAEFGCRWNIPATGPNKGYPLKIDAMRHGRQVEVTAGEIANPATFAALATYADDNARRWGIVQGTDTGLTQQGIVYWGTAAAAVYSRVANKTLVLLDTLGFTVTDFTQIIFANASTDLEWTNVSVLSLDTLNRGIVTVNNNAPVSFFGCSFNDIDTTADGGTNSVWDGSIWRRTNAVTSAGGSFLGCSFIESTAALNTSALIYNVATNPSGILDGCQFTMGAAASHAIEFGLTSPISLDLNNIDFSGYGASNAANDSMIHIKRTSGTVTINLSGVTIDGGAGTVTYRTDGATVVLVAAAQLELTGLKNPTEVRVYDEGTTTEIAGQEDVTSGTFTTSIDSATYPAVDISIISLGFQNFRLLNISMATDRSVPISQVIDRQYENP